ncbi:type IV secretion IcmS family protein [Coxiella burnetii]|uniref:IcmS n=1 Tax=Coxiella burnetii (strain RSA 493 / Nine Mile phase I) TaxID=227377 RepID=Q83B73_COXBU|nr:type IV secretion IcmS family protein [Coxiella burnetii]NP_820624.1 Icm secretion system protein IcmS [Coxiella burnetii RSA 493]AAO91138.1 IcmS [Coxiella burnetii RSA 493]ABX78869.1 IcmS protein [Coxiella burnetii RSA 331]ACJ20982.1 IcmS [Coxiella burnetii CbuK_Q154]AIT64063.1 IcmS [Coxiella burnetii str. Namibia]ARI66399.1 type IV secretion protein IcmS [Coxiella burnetii]
MQLANKLTALTKKIGANFTLKGRHLAYSEMFSDTGLLPGLTKRADQLASLCLGYGLGATYEDTENSLLGVKVKFDEFTPDVLRLFCILDVIYELVKNSPSKDAVSLDELMYD